MAQDIPGAGEIARALILQDARNALVYADLVRQALGQDRLKGRTVHIARGGDRQGPALPLNGRKCRHRHSVPFRVSDR